MYTLKTVCSNEFRAIHCRRIQLASYCGKMGGNGGAQIIPTVIFEILQLTA